jgi:hypothetical protein
MGNPGALPVTIGAALSFVGILVLSLVFVPIGFILLVIGLFISFHHKNKQAIGIGIIGIVVSIIGFMTSPTLLALTGLYR